MYDPTMIEAKAGIPKGNRNHGSSKGQLVPGLLHTVSKYAFTRKCSARPIPVNIKKKTPIAKTEIPMIRNFFTRSNLLT